MERMDTEELVELSRRAREGDDEARNAIVEANLGECARVGAGMRRRMWHVRDSMMDGDDFVQEASLGLLRAAGSFDPGRGDDPDAWFRWNMRNATIDAAKSLWRDDRRRAAAARPEVAPDRTTSVERRDFVEWLESHLPRRQGTQRAVVRMRSRDGLGSAEVAEKLGLSVEMVHTHYSWALGRMRRAVAADPDARAALADLVS